MLISASKRRGGKTPPRLYLPCLLFVLCSSIFEKKTVSFGESEQRGYQFDDQLYCNSGNQRLRLSSLDATNDVNGTVKIMPRLPEIPCIISIPIL